MVPVLAIEHDIERVVEGGELVAVFTDQRVKLVPGVGSIPARAPRGSPAPAEVATAKQAASQTHREGPATTHSPRWMRSLASRESPGWTRPSAFVRRAVAFSSS